MKLSSVLIGEADPLFSDWLKKTLASAFRVVGAEGDGRALVFAADRLQPDAIIADISLLSSIGMDAAKEIRLVSANSKIIWLTSSASNLPHARKASENGATYISKKAAAAQLIDTVRAALGQEKRESQLDRLGRSRGSRPRVRQLTDRQQEILRFVADGNSNKEIAVALEISAKTVEFHKYRLMAHLRVRSTAELISVAIRCHLV
jgi:DNA-binding NarL/FixJ family response regulator